MSFWARVVLVPVAVIGAVLSFRSLYEAAKPTFGPQLGAGFPLLVDLLILGASLQYVAGAKVGRPMAGWRLTAHAGVVATLVLNALAAQELGEVPWHVTAPAVWAVLVELTAKQVLGEWKANHTAARDRISFTLWLTAPFESARTRLLMLRTGLVDAAAARNAVGVHAAAREALRLALPSHRGRRVRKVIHRQLRAGSLPPAAILRPLGWGADGEALNDRRPETILQAVLHDVLDSTVRPVPSPAAADEVRPEPGAAPRPADRPRGRNGARRPGGDGRLRDGERHRDGEARRDGEEPWDGDQRSDWDDDWRRDRDDPLGREDPFGREDPLGREDRSGRDDDDEAPLREDDPSRTRPVPVGGRSGRGPAPTARFQSRTGFQAPARGNPPTGFQPEHPAPAGFQLSPEVAAPPADGRSGPVPATQVQVTPAPVAEVPMVEVPAAHAPVVQPLVTEAPAPVAQAPVTRAPVAQTPVVQTPVVQTPVAQAPVAQTPVAQAPATQAPTAPAPTSPVPVPTSPAPVRAARPAPETIAQTSLLDAPPVVPAPTVRASARATPVDPAPTYRPAARTSPGSGVTRTPARRVVVEESVEEEDEVGYADPSEFAREPVLEDTQHLDDFDAPEMLLFPDDPEPASPRASARDTVAEDAANASAASGRAEQKLRAEQRMEDAIELVGADASITGPGLRIALARRGWVLSDSTATRILPDARLGAARRRQARSTAGPRR